MTIEIKHAFVSGHADGADATQVQPSNWNAALTTSMATARLIGRTTAGAGEFEEITVSTGLTFSGGVLSVAADTYQPIDATLTSIAALTPGADTAIYFSGSDVAATFSISASGRALANIGGTIDTFAYLSAADTWSLTSITAAGRAILDDADAATQRATLAAAGSGAVGSSGLTMNTDRLLGRTTAAAGAIEEITVSTGLTFSGGVLSVAANTYQPIDATLTTIAALTPGADTAIYFTGSDVATTYTLNAAGRALAGMTGTADTFPYFSALNVVGNVTISASGRALANIGGTIDTFAYLSAADTWSLTSITAAGRAILDDADAATQRATLAAAGSGAVGSSGLTMNTARLLGRTTAATGAIEEITISTGLTFSGGVLSVTADTYQPIDATLTTIAALTPTADQAIYFTGSDVAATFTVNAAGRALTGMTGTANTFPYFSALNTVGNVTISASGRNLANIGGTAARIAYTSATDTWTLTAISAAGRSVINTTGTSGSALYFSATDTIGLFATSASGRALANIGGTSGNFAYLSGTNTWSLTTITASGRGLAAIAGTSGTFPYLSGTDTWSLATITAAGRAILDDADATAQIATLGIASATLTFTNKRINQRVVTLTDGATVAVNSDNLDIGNLSAAGNRTLLAPSGTPVDGQRFTVRHYASGGTRTLALTTGTSGSYAFGEDITGLTATTSGKYDEVGFQYNSTLDRWMVIAYAKGY